MNTAPTNHRDPIEYLLNAMERAGQEDKPAEHGYSEKRRAVLAAIVELRAERDAAKQQAKEAEELAAEALMECNCAVLERDAALRRANEQEASAEMAEHDADAQEQRAEVRRLQQQAEQALVTRIEAIEQGNSLAQRLIEQRDAALAKRDAAERNEREYRAACEMSICALRDSRERWEQRAVLAEAERDKARHMLTVYGCRDAAGHNEDDCPLCSAEHALLNTREYLTEARRVLRAQDECMVCKAELFRDLTVPHCFDCVVEDEHAEEWDAICAAKAAVLAQEEQP